MTPMARTATQILGDQILKNSGLLENDEQLKQNALMACAAAFVDAGYDLDRDEERFGAFLDDHAANVVDIAISMVLFLAAQHKRKKFWGGVGKAAALVGAAGLGAFFG